MYNKLFGELNVWSGLDTEANQLAFSSLLLASPVAGPT